MTAPEAPTVPRMAEPGVAVELDQVHRSFGDNPALAGLTLRVPEAQITVLLGPNGAGKTTAIRMVTGALNPDQGTVRVFGLDPDADGEAVRRRCGVVSAKPSLYDRLSGYDNLAYSAELYGLGRGVAARAAIVESAARFGIDHALAQQAGGYSTGMKTRLALARSVLHGPELLLFDEPTSGLDPESSHAVLDLIREMTATGATVIMCTHLLLEAEGLADQVVILEDGRDLVSGSPGELTKRYWPGAVVRLDAEDRSTLDRLATAEGVLNYDRADGELASVQIDDMGRVPELVLALAADGVRLTRVEPHTPTLEDLYFAVRGRRATGVTPSGEVAVPRDPTPLADVKKVTSGNRVGRRFRDPFAASRDGES
jgi:ABC-type multidrug transport system ATPase subunit